MEQLSTNIQVIGSLITLVILPLLLIKSKAKKADAEAEKTEADNITAYAAEWKELYEKKEKHWNSENVTNTVVQTEFRQANTNPINYQA